MWAQDGIVLENMIKIRTWEVEVMVGDQHDETKLQGME